jgi:inorganic pyrophosphatase
MNIHTVPFGEMEKFNVFIEVPEGSRNKYEYDEGFGLVALDFVFSGDLRFPYNYGFICGTRGGDGDHLDAIVLSSESLVVGSLISCRAIGIMEVIDRGEEDSKIICVPVVDPLGENYSDIGDLSEEHLQSFMDFLNEVAVQKNKIMEVKGYHGKAPAIDKIQKALV